MQTRVYVKHIKLKLMWQKVTATLRSSLKDNFEFLLKVVYSLYCSINSLSLYHLYWLRLKSVANLMLFTLS